MKLIWILTGASLGAKKLLEKERKEFTSKLSIIANKQKNLSNELEAITTEQATLATIEEILKARKHSSSNKKPIEVPCNSKK